jgi:glutamyl endopeptidase
MRGMRFAVVILVLLLGTGGLVAAGRAQPRSEPVPLAGPVAVDDGDGTVVLFRHPGDTQQPRPGGRSARELRSSAPSEALRALRGDVFSTYPADFDPVPRSRLLSAGPSALYDEQVIGSDNRVRVRNTKRYPASATSQVYIYDSYSRQAVDEDLLCTGGIVGAANLLVTAAHCVYDPEVGRWYDDWVVYPGRKNKNKAPFGACSWERIYVHRKWVTTGRREYDTAAVILDCNVGDRTGWYGARQSSGNGFIAGTHEIYQYPGDKPFGTQWYDAGPWSQVGSFREGVATRVAPAGRAVNGAVYLIDTAPGSSGASVIHAEGPEDYYLTAVHSAGSPEANFGVLLWKQVWKKVIYKAYKRAIR